MSRIADEAHVYAPETGEAESANAVKGLCSRGRKRGFCAVLATQRLSKLAKDAAAELNNKLIGRTSLDVDMARAGDELGFTKANRLVLRDLEDGEFYAFGPALSRVVTKVHVGGVATQHPKAGKLAAVPAPSARIKALLPKLSDLPAETEAREKNLAELRAELATVRRELTAVKRAQPKTTIKTIEKAVLKAGHLTRIEKLAYQVLQTSGELALAAKVISDAIGRVAASENAEKLLRTAAPPAPGAGKPAPAPISQKSENLPRRDSAAPLPPGELAILTAVVQTPGLDRKRLSVLVGYKKSSRDVYIQRLSKQGYVTVDGKQVHPTDDGRRALGDSYQPLPTGAALIEHWRQKLPVGECEIFDLLLAHGPAATVSRETIKEVTGKKKSSTDVYIQRLAARGLVASVGRGVVRLENLTGE